jgi:hypothetical protein
MAAVPSGDTNDVTYDQKRFYNYGDHGPQYQIG